MDRDDGITNVDMQHFEKVEVVRKKGNTIKRFRTVSKSANLSFIIDFIKKLLNEIINHRNHLKHYRNTIHSLEDLYNTTLIDIDFFKNLSGPVKCEPKSLHWSHQQITVHSGLMKYQGEK